MRIFKRIDKNIIILIMIFLFVTPFALTPWIYSDGVGEFAWVHSIFMDGNLNSRNEFVHYGLEFQKEYGWKGFGEDLYLVNTKTGVQANKYPIGSALLWFPFFLIGHIITLIANAIGANIPVNGYSKYYIYLVSFGSALYAFIGLILSYLIAKKFFRPTIALLATIGIWFASSLPVYMFLYPSMPHANSLFVVALFLFYWISIRSTSPPKMLHWIFLGLLGGLTMLVRLENVVFLVLPEIDLLIIFIKYFKNKNSLKIKQIIFCQSTYALFSIIAFIPQMIVWKQVFGKFFLNPYTEFEKLVQLSLIQKYGGLKIAEAGVSQGSGILSFLKFLGHPHLYDTLIGSSYGIFTWTPILFISILGLLISFRRKKTINLLLFLGIFLLVYVTSCLKKGGMSFGDRYLIQGTVIYIFGLASLLSLFWTKIKPIILVGIVCLFIVWNGLFIVQYSTGLIPRRGPISWSTMIYNQFNAAPVMLIKKLKPFLLYRNSAYKKNSTD